MAKVSSERCIAGSAAVEFALTVPILMIFVIGTADYGVMAYQQAALVAAARAGAEYASAYVRKDTTNVLPTCYVNCGSNSNVNYVAMPSGATITASKVCTCWTGSGTPASCLGVTGGPPDGSWGDCTSGTEMDYVQVTAQISSYQPLLGRNLGITSFFIPQTLSVTTYLRVQ